MLIRIFFTLLYFLVSSCSIIPGMQNPDTSHMQMIKNPEQPIVPILIPITPTLLSNESLSNYIYHIAPADVINIDVWQHPEFSIKTLYSGQTGLPSTQGAAGQEGYLVNSQGYIYFPLIGKLYVAGKTIDQTRSLLAKRLKKYVVSPQVSLRVMDFRGQKIYVFGEILKPGFVPLSDQPLSITDAISLSGGLDPNAADTSHIYIIRGNIYKPYIYWLNAKTPEALLMAEQFSLKPGDILYVSSAAATRWNRVLNQLLPTIQTVWYTKSIMNSN